MCEFMSKEERYRRWVEEEELELLEEEEIELKKQVEARSDLCGSYRLLDYDIDRREKKRNKYQYGEE